jgi:hypothetical protein
MMVRSGLAPLTILLITATGLWAQEAPLPPRPPIPPPAHLDPTRVTPYHQSFRMVLVQNGAEQQIGSLEDQVSIADDHGQRSIIRSEDVNGPTGNMLDSSVADPSTLAPRRHSSHGERRNLALEFTDARITGAYQDAGDPPIPVDDKVNGRVFDSNLLDVLISAMPLADGYSGRLTVYLYDAGGSITADLTVTGSDKVGAMDCWVAGVTIGGRTVRYYVSKTDHRVVEILSVAGDGTELRIVRDPLP